MKNNLLKFIYTFIFIFTSTLIFSQGANDAGGGLEDDDPPAAPINSKLLIVAIFGILLAYYTFKNNKKTV